MLIIKIDDRTRTCPFVHALKYQDVIYIPPAPDKRRAKVEQPLNHRLCSSVYCTPCILLPAWMPFESGGRLLDGSTCIG